MKKPIRWHQTLMIILLVTFFPLISSCEKDIFDDDSMEDGSTPGNASRASSAVATDWYALQLQMIIKANPSLNPILLTRAWGYIGIGLYESVRPGIKHSVSLSHKLYQMPPMPENENNNGYSWEVSANAALAKLIASFYPAAVVSANQQRIDSLETRYNDSLRPGVTSTVFLRSQSFGRAIAEAIIVWSQTDNSNLGNAGYVPPVFPGAWEPTPPALANGLCPYFGNTRSFIAKHAQVVAPSFPHAYSDDPGSDFYKMEKAMYDLSLSLTQEQKNIALYWNDVGVGIGYSPPGHSVSILTQILKQKGVDLGKAAIAYAKTGIALTDASIAGFKSKYTHNLMRPVTYIKKVIDPSWNPLIVTPPHPEYPAAHAFLTQAFMEAMTGIFGNNFSFIDNTYGSKYGGARTFPSFNAAAEECGMSRRYGGIHRSPSIVAGLELGKQIGQSVNDLELVRPPSN
ncbi:MAG: phosphoesterase [Marivirga sp.]|nr:phosphoesterase [Marivirga sp.]